MRSRNISPLESAGWMDAQVYFHKVGRRTEFYEMEEEMRRKCLRGYNIGDIPFSPKREVVLSAREWRVTRDGDGVQTNAGGAETHQAFSFSANTAGIAVREVSMSRMRRYGRTPRGC